MNGYVCLPLTMWPCNELGCWAPADSHNPECRRKWGWKMDGWLTLCFHLHGMFIISIQYVFFYLYPDNHKANKKKDQRHQTPSLVAATAMLPVGKNRQSVTKPIKRLHSRMGPTKSKATVKNKTVKCALGQSAYSLVNQKNTRQK